MPHFPFMPPKPPFVGWRFRPRPFMVLFVPIKFLNIMRKNPIFVFSLSLVLVLTLITPHHFRVRHQHAQNTLRRALGKVVQNSTSHYFYKINDTFAFGCSPKMHRAIWTLP